MSSDTLTVNSESLEARLQETLARLPAGCAPGPALRALVAAGLDRLPLPGSGRTLDRWRALAQVAGHDLGLAKLYEGHTDALAILAELDGPPAPAHAIWGVWCAEPPDARIAAFKAAPVSSQAAGAIAPAAAWPRLRLRGTKAWCSGAHEVSHALVSAWNANGEQCLAAVEMDQPGVTVTSDGWHAVGMASAGSVDVRLEDAVGLQVGPPGAYTSRAGFWHGGAGIAACWHGALARIAQYVLEAARVQPGPHRLAHLGAIDVALVQCAALLAQTARQIDRDPAHACMTPVRRARLAVEAAAEDVMRRAERALGAAPLCRDAAFARLMADLPVFVRQSHAERDQASHGQQLFKESSAPWRL